VFDALDPRNPTPMYAQIAARVRVAVAAGELAAGEPLPSVRALATRLRVNPATVVQAYRELAHEGVVDTRQGAGTFVSPIPSERRASARQAEARRLVRHMLEEAARSGIGAPDLQRALAHELAEVRK
jgi:GntR family transcriptional regulator